MRTPLIVLGCLLVLAGATGGWWWLRSSKSTPWTASGLTMEERLAAIAEGEPEIYGPSLKGIAPKLRKLWDEGDTKQATFVQQRYAVWLLRNGRYADAVKFMEDLLGRYDGKTDPQSVRITERIRTDLVAAQLRWGEDQNCLANHNADSCLLPISGGGVHKDPSAFLAARAVLEDILADDPGDTVARWLLNLTAMATEQYPAGVPDELRIDPQVFRSEVEFPRFLDAGSGLGIGVNRLSGSSALEDFDGDGDIDLVASSMGFRDELHYFENQGDGTFADKTREAGLEGQFGGLNLTTADYDNDGLCDVLVLRGGWMAVNGTMPNSLLKNEGGRFRDVTEEAGILQFRATHSAAFADVDLDGWLDLYVANESTAKIGLDHPGELYVNQGDGTFVDRFESSGIAPGGLIKGVTFGDFDNDLAPDLYLSRYDGVNSLYRNRGDGTFEDVTSKAGLSDETRSFACWFFDYDNDGWQDLFTAGYGAQFNSDEGDTLRDIPGVRLGREVPYDALPRLYRNRGDGTFEDKTRNLGLDRVVMTMGANFGDIDNDGFQDIYLGTGHPDFRALMANRMFKNDGGERFLDVTTAGGFGHLQKGHGISFADVDADGDQDVYAVLGGWFASDNFPNALFENPGNGNGWVTLRFEGVDAPRSGAGARVRLTVATPGGRREIHRSVGVGGSFGSNSLQLEVGLADATAIDELRVQWTSGTTDTLSGLEPGRIWRIREGASAAIPIESAPITLTPGEHAHHHEGMR